MMSEYSFRLEKILLLVELWSSRWGKKPKKQKPLKTKTKQTKNKTNQPKKQKTKQKTKKTNRETFQFTSCLDCGVLLAHKPSQACHAAPVGGLVVVTLPWSHRPGVLGWFSVSFCGVNSWSFAVHPHTKVVLVVCSPEAFLAIYLKH